MDLHATTLTADDHDGTVPSLSASGTSEAVKFLMEFSLDSAKRTKMRVDKAAFLAETDLSEEAKALVQPEDSKLLLSAVTQGSAEMLIVVVLETVTTDVIVV